MICFWGFFFTRWSLSSLLSYEKVKKKGPTAAIIPARNVCAEALELKEI